MKNKRELASGYDMRTIAATIVMLFMFLLGLTFMIHDAYGADGQSVYNQTCAACHSTGVAGAPKTGDKAAWTDRIAKGNATLYTHAIKGFTGQGGLMPAKGGNAALSDEDVKAAVDYMLATLK